MRVFNSNANKEFINYNFEDLIQKKKIVAPESDQVFIVKFISKIFWIFF